MTDHVAPERTATLAHHIRDMIIAELPGIATLNDQMTFIETSPDSQRGDHLDIIVRPVDFLADSIRVTVSMRIDSIAREPQTPVAITVGIDA